MKKKIKQKIALLVLLIGCFIFFQYSIYNYLQPTIEPLSEEERKALFAVKILREDTDNPIINKLPKECIDYFSLTMCDCMGDEHYKKVEKARKKCINARQLTVYLKKY